MAHLIKSKASGRQVLEMLEVLKDYIKVAVDIEKSILAGGGAMHADCEEVLLENGSKQKDVWGADWFPKEKRVAFKSLINIRPRQNNRSMEIQDPELRDQVERVIRGIFEP